MKKGHGINSLKYGTFSLIVSVLVIAVTVIINVAVDLLPTAVKNIDISEHQTYSVGDVTKETVSELKEDVTIYLLGEKDKINERLILLTENYADLSGHISIKQIDPDEKPAFLQEMGIQAGDLSGNTDILVASEKRNKLVAYKDIFKVDTQSYAYYRAGLSNSYNAYFDGEGAVTSAISYVTSDELPKMYMLKGHGEKDLNENVKSLLVKCNMVTDELNLVTGGAVPDDCDVLMIYLPSTDITESEKDILVDYVAHGGKCIVFNSSENMEKKVNYKAFLKYYGVGVTENSYIFEGTSNCVYPKRFWLYEPAEMSGIEGVTGFIFSPNTSAILQDENMRKTLKVTPLLTTSDDSWLRMDLSSDTLDEKIDSDIDGPFDFAVSVVDQTNEGEGKLVLFSSDYFLEFATLDNIVTGYANGEAFVSVLSGLASLKAGVSIPAKQAGVIMNTFTVSEFRMGLGIFVIGIPLFILLAGFCLWFSRRKR